MEIAEIFTKYLSEMGIGDRPVVKIVMPVDKVEGVIEEAVSKAVLKSLDDSFEAWLPGDIPGSARATRSYRPQALPIELILASARRLMVHLIIVNIVVVLLDVNILTIEYARLYNIQTAYKGLVYSVKLKVEFSILNRLVELTRLFGSSYTRSGEDGAGGVQMPQIFDGTRDLERQGQDSLSRMYG
ncbi:hypothetical protein B0T16DRAFT_453310 [Cercophora newfieldiana]|uniref:DUF7703 domain-containing protein n=1 Tax=Cercophora newfieldiana TaxID=92897 RepID=A0AA40D274_9PEZI|nr:hypothetical protein B0T16DRAFT_453310 [Cercophora newfieldiana]